MMLAYTTFSDIFVVPTVLEAAVYFGGLLLVLAAPYLLLRTLDSMRKHNREEKGTDLQQPKTQ